MKKFKILFGTNYAANDTTSFLRAYGPFSLMREHVEIVEPKLTYRKNVGANASEQLELDLQSGWWNDWRNFRGVDCCFLHRPYGLLGGAIINACKIHGVPLWIDHDDDLLAIPESNPHYKVHRDGEKLFPGVLLSYKEADILTCSGRVMHKDLIENHNRPDAILITTGLDDELLRLKKPFNKNNKIAWRGSTSHKSDLEHFKTPIENVAKNHPELYWHWLGIDVRQIFEDVFEGEFSPIRSHLPFLKELCDTNASIHIVPLEDNKFNRVKSNLAWLDATLAGSAVLGPDFEEWTGIPTVNLYYDVKHFETALEQMITHNGNLLEQMHNESWRYIQENLMTSKLNEKRLEILNKLGYREARF